MKKIILASGSPRRKMLLDWAEIPHDVLVSDVEEKIDHTLSPEMNAEAIAQSKNNAVYSMLKGSLGDRIIVSADTIVVLDQTIIGKPINKEDAVGILERLSGRTHAVVTAVCIRNTEKELLFHDSTRVGFHSLTLSQIHHYVDQYKPYDKAGAYAIQEWIGVVGINAIEGDFYNVMGLPISRVIRCLERDFGWGAHSVG